MNINDFENVIVKGIGDYLPEEYKGFEISIERVTKTNGVKDCLRIMDPKKAFPSPNLYIDEMFDMYRNGASMEDVFNFAVSMFVYGMDYACRMAGISEQECQRMDNIIVQVVGAFRNVEMLKGVPHKDLLDLGIIYRHLIVMPDGSFNMATVDEKQMESMGISIDELHALAMENTKRMLPYRAEALCDDVFVITNEHRLLGASVLLCKDHLRAIAEKCGEDIYMIPSSIHEMMVCPVSHFNVKFLKDLLKDTIQNGVVDPEEVLTETIYRYDYARDIVLPAMEE